MTWKSDMCTIKHPPPPIDSVTPLPTRCRQASRVDIANRLFIEAGWSRLSLPPPPPPPIPPPLPKHAWWIGAFLRSLNRRAICSRMLQYDHIRVVPASYYSITHKLWKICAQQYGVLVLTYRQRRLSQHALVPANTIVYTIVCCEIQYLEAFKKIALLHVFRIKGMVCCKRYMKYIRKLS